MESFERDPKIVGVDYDMTLYELTELFYQYYNYHNNNMLMDYTDTVGYNIRSQQLAFQTKSLSRFDAFRRIEASRLGSRPFSAADDIAKHRPNVSFGYMDWFLKYLVLPYKAMLTESDVAKIRINKKLFDVDKLTDAEKEEMMLDSANNPNKYMNNAVGDAVTDAFVDVLRISKQFSECTDQLPRRVAQDGIAACLHCDVSWTPTIVNALDLVTEPQATWHPEDWSCFFVIKKLTAAEAVRHIRDNTPFWDTNALRWALECALTNNSVLNSYQHYNYYGMQDAARGENYMIRSYYNEKARRVTNVGSYYGNMLVVEGYYLNKEGKVDKVVFFPSNDFLNVTPEERTRRYTNYQLVQENREGELSVDDQILSRANVLFRRTNVFSCLKDAITIIPFDRAEPSLERQRGYCHELFAPIECTMRIDSAILNFTMLMGVPFTRNRVQGTDAQDIEDLEVNTNGDTVDLGDREFVTLPYTADLNAMVAVRQMLISHTASKAFLGGLDGEEMKANGRGAQMANMRLVRDGRVHKHTVEDFSEGLKELYTKTLVNILKLKKRLLMDDTLINKRFFSVIEDVEGFDPEILKFDEKDVIEDTGLPYWMTLDILRNGASHFGAAELVLYTEIKNILGDSLSQKSMQALNRMTLKGLLGSEDAIDILGDPKEQLVTDQDQVYRAKMENASILGSVDNDILGFEEVLVLFDKDDHVLHLSQVHNPKAQEIIQTLESSEVSPAELEQFTEEQLTTRTNLILRLAALSTHIAPHMEALSMFGKSREDVNRLREETNVILQTSEALVNNLQITLRALQARRQENEMRLRNMSPENTLEREKIELELVKLRAESERDKGKLALANRVADMRQQQHIDKQVSKARDRAQKERVAQQDAIFKNQELLIQSTDVAGKNFERSANAFKNSFGGGTREQ